jgi:hypothetical protein
MGKFKIPSHSTSEWSLKINKILSLAESQNYSYKIDAGLCLLLEITAFEKLTINDFGASECYLKPLLCCCLSKVDSTSYPFFRLIGASTVLNTEAN